MKILIADDEPVSRLLIEALLTEWGHQVVAATNGVQALNFPRHGTGPPLAVLDWEMPGLDGVQVCELARRIPALKGLYIILLTSRSKTVDLVKGLESGANDFIAKPFDAAELRARVKVGVRLVELQDELTARLEEVKHSRQEVKQLSGLLPICAHCKKIRNDENFWQQVESYVSEHTKARFSQGICPECHAKVLRELARQLPPEERGIGTPETSPTPTGCAISP